MGWGSLLIGVQVRCENEDWEDGQVEAVDGKIETINLRQVLRESVMQAA